MDEKATVKLHDHFYNKSHLFGNKIAVSFYSGVECELSITYKELCQRSLTTSAIITNHLKSLSNTSIDTVVGLYCDAGIPAMVFILSILRAGAFFYLSPDLTKNELSAMLERVIVKYIVIQNTYQNRIPENFSPKILTSIEILNVQFNLICLTVSKSSDQSVLNRGIITKDSLAYVISTSGTTGYPKIVYVCHKCIIQNIEDFKSIFDIKVDDAILNLSPLHFDPSIVDIFLSLSYGARLIILSPHILKQPRILEKIMNCNSISFMQITPTLFRTLDPEFLKTFLENKNLKSLAFGGENFPSQSEFNRWFNLSSEVKIYNLYGLTEMSCWATYHKVDMNKYLSASPEENIGPYCSIPLGKPLTGVEIFLIDKFGNKIIKGEGQIFLSGERNLCFIDDPDDPNLGIGNSIKTGDIGYSNGANLFYLERSDNIIKRNACKISLLEIELVSQCLKEVRERCAVYFDNKIYLFVSSHSSKLSEETVNNHLRSFLLPWKLPDRVIIKKNLPLNRNFKVNRKSLLNSIISEKMSKILNPEGKDVSNLLQVLWKEFIGHYPKDEENFISSGGNSLQAVQLAEKIHLYIPDNPLILQTIINNSFKDLLKLAYNNSKQSDLEIQESRKFKKPYPCCSKKIKGLFKVYRHGGNSFICKNFKLNEFLYVKWTVSLDKCIDSSPLVLESKDEVRIFIGSHSHKFLCINNLGIIYWKINLPDRIEGSAVVSSSGDTVYIGCYDGIFYCIDIYDGKYLWTLKTEGIIKTTCVVDSASDSVIFGSYDKNLYCCSEKGVLKWKNKLSNGYIKSSSAVYNNCVFTGTLDGYVVCSCLYTGNLVWKIFIKKPIFSSLIASSFGIIFGSADNCVYCVNFESSILWTYKTNGPIFSSPCIFQNDSLNIIAIGSHDNCLYLLDIYGKEILSFQTFSPVYTTPFIIIENSEKFHVLFAETSGCIYCLEIHVIDGNFKPYNIQTLQLTNNVFSSPVFYKQNIYIGCRDNMLYCLGT